VICLSASSIVHSAPILHPNGNIFLSLVERKFAWIFLMHINSPNWSGGLHPYPWKSCSLSIQMAASTGYIDVDNLTEMPIMNAKEAGNFYQQGSQSRSTSCTNANQTSSRSHWHVPGPILCISKSASALYLQCKVSLAPLARQRLGNLVVICEGLAYKVLKFTNLNCSLEINLWSSPGSVLYLPLMFGI
jgi:hypothetical protein